MSLMPSFKTMGIWGAVLAVLAYLFRDNPMIQGLIEMFTGPKDQPKEKPQAAAGGASSAGGAAPKAEAAEAAASAPAQTPQQHAAQVMLQFKEGLKAVPPQVQQAIALREQEMQASITTALTQPNAEARIKQIQMEALEQAAKPDLEKFISSLKQQQQDHYKELIAEISRQRDLPQKEKNEAIAALRKEAKAAERALEKEIKGLTPDVALQLALNPEAQKELLAKNQEKFDKQSEGAKANLSEAIKNHKGSGWSTGGTALSICSLGLAVTGGILTFTGVGTPLGLGLIAAGTCATGAAGGFCNYKAAEIQESTLGKTFALAEIGLSALPLVGKGLGIGLKMASGLSNHAGDIGSAVWKMSPSALGKAVAQGTQEGWDAYRVGVAANGVDKLGNTGKKLLGNAFSMGGGSLDDISRTAIGELNALGTVKKEGIELLEESLKVVAGKGGLKSSSRNLAAAESRFGGYFDIADEAKAIAKQVGLEENSGAEKIIGDALTKAAVSNGHNVGAAARYLAGVTDTEMLDALNNAGRNFVSSGKGTGLSNTWNFSVAAGNGINLALGELSPNTPIIPSQPGEVPSGLKK